MRIYGCPAWVYESHPQPLYVIDGRTVPIGSGWWARHHRSAMLQELRPEQIESIDVISPRDSVRWHRYGPAGAHGVVLITLKHAVQDITIPGT